LYRLSIYKSILSAFSSESSINDSFIEDEGTVKAPEEFDSDQNQIPDIAKSNSHVSQPSVHLITGEENLTTSKSYMKRIN